MTEQVYPAWHRAIALLETLAAATDDAGLWRFKGGAQAYAYELGASRPPGSRPTRFTRSACAGGADQKEMDAILRKLGRTEGTVAARLEARADLAYPAHRGGPHARSWRTSTDHARCRAPGRDAVRPQPKRPVVARPFPRFREASAAANYNAPPLDGSRPASSRCRCGPRT